MITNFEISGFKSLQNFKLSFKKGLNVLIGPNGAGKTNICQALGLTAAAAQGTISDYLLSLGSAFSAFSLSCTTDPTEKKKRGIEAAVKGEIVEEKVTLRYNYTFSISFDKDIRIDKESFKLFKKAKTKYFRNVLNVERNPENKINIHIKRPEDIGPRYTELLKDRKKISFKSVEGPLRTFLPLLGILFFYCDLVKEDISFSSAWNIDPYVAKKNSDILEPYKMLPDGKRLANAIHGMYNSDDDRMDEIKTFMSRILKNFSDIVPTTATDGSRTFSINDTKGINYPAHCLSDGTVKALALLIGILSEGQSSSIIEEPENYLHPWACQLLIDFFRDHFTDGVCILTTHSETILNTIKPKEVIIVENLQGATTRRRLSSEKELTNAIRASGFGIGYHYIAGSLGGTPE